jgi:hypothetical protein
MGYTNYLGGTAVSAATVYGLYLLFTGMREKRESERTRELTPHRPG